MKDIPLGLKSAIESGECVLFIGAGIGRHLSNEYGNSPDGLSLAKELADSFKINTVGEYELSKIAEIVEIRKGRKELIAFLTKRLSNLEPDQVIVWLFSQRWKAIYTTNYDKSIKRAYELQANPIQETFTVTLSSDIRPYDPRLEVPIIHIHGTLFGTQDSQIVITENDYSRFREQRRMLWERLKYECATSTILYVGYSNNDYNWKIVLSEIRSEFSESKLPVSFRISPSTNEIDEEILQKRNNILTINLSLEEFKNKIESELKEIDYFKGNIEKIKDSIPTDFHDIFDKSPAALVRFFSSWEYVNQASFNENPNVINFLQGDRPNWSLIGAEEYFKRDIEEEIYDVLLDFATSTKSKPDINIILGPAGYGITTLLMTLAVRLVKEKAGPVFFHKSNRSILEGDIEFAANNISERVFFFIDGASDYSDKLNTIVRRLRETKKPAFLMLGERLNEWRIGHGKLNCNELALEPLSDPEINRLLDYLDKHNSLNKLKELKRELQFSAIKNVHGKELLVAMKEATEGKSFDAILEDEYLGIGDFLSKKLYLTVCCYYQHGALIRDGILSDLLGIPITELYQKTSVPTEGVVIFECIDPYYETYAARARHRIIATIVWERCGNAVEKEQILQHSISNLNLQYRIDRDAFEYLIRSDRIVDTIQTLDGKIKYFDKGCNKDPENPYVRQHYARMLSRECRFNLALDQIEKAIGLNSKIRVLYHTKGMILMQIMSNVESIDIARKRMIQSESSFNTGLNMYSKDEYCYQGLSQLYFEWAKKTNDPEEMTHYIQKAEEIISNGLKVVNVRDGLFIESSEIQKYLGDMPSCARQLEKAIEGDSGSIVARYLLARHYRKEGRYQEAIDILEPLIKNNQEEYRSIIEYSLSHLYNGGLYSEATAILNLGRLYGLSDARFIAIYGGMLFMDGKFSESDEVFSQTSKRLFTALELNTIYFQPPDQNDLKKLLRIGGTVIAVKAGYSLVESPGYPKFLCPGSKYNSLLMQKGLKISFIPSFTAKGNIAYMPEVQ